MSTLTKQDIIRAWKDADFRNQLSAEQLAELPENPAGIVELSSAELDEVSGGQKNIPGVPDLEDLVGPKFTDNGGYTCNHTDGIQCEGRTLNGNFLVSR